MFIPHAFLGPGTEEELSQLKRNLSRLRVTWTQGNGDPNQPITAAPARPPQLHSLGWNNGSFLSFVLLFFIRQPRSHASLCLHQL